MKKKNARIICLAMTIILSAQILLPSVQADATDDLSSSSIASSESIPPSSLPSASERQSLCSVSSAAASSSSSSSSKQSPNRSNASSAKAKKSYSSLASAASFTWTQEMTVSVDNACKWLALNDTDQNSLLVMGIAGKSADITTATREQQKIAEKEGVYENPNDLSLDILTLVFSGMNPENFQGLNLIHTLYEYQNLPSMDVLSNALALIALDSNQFLIPNDALNTRDSIIASILQAQKEDGGFIANEEDEFLTTAMAIAALAPYQEQDAVRAGLQSALSYLQDQFNQMKSVSCNALSYLTIAASSLNIPADDKRFTNSDNSLVDSIMDYQLSDGSFAADKNTQQPDVFATELAICAMIAARNQESPFILQNGVAYMKEKETDDSLLMFLLMILSVLLIAAVVICIVAFKKRKKPQITGKERDNDPSDNADSISK